MNLNKQEQVLPALTLRAALEDDVNELMTWFPDQESVQTWGGATFRYPFSLQSFREDIAWRQVRSFTMVRGAGQILAFGQLYERAKRTHLARLAVTPGRRGEGLGSKLISELMRAGSNYFPHREYSLYVFRSNLAALRCYRRLGFVETSYPEGEKPQPGCAYMVRADALV